MKFYEVVNRRRTIRDFSSEPVEEEAIRRIIAAGLKAPTNDHLRDWHFVVVNDEAAADRLISLVPEEVSGAQVDSILQYWNLKDENQKNMYRDAIPKQYQMLRQAGALVIPLFRQKTDLLRPESLSALNAFASIWCCIENIFLAAAAEGYACALRIPLGMEQEHARSVLGYPRDYCMPCFIAIGKPADGAKEIHQKEISPESRIHWNGW